MTTTLLSAGLRPCYRLLSPRQLVANCAKTIRRSSRWQSSGTDTEDISNTAHAIGRGVVSDAIDSVGAYHSIDELVVQDHNSIRELCQRFQKEREESKKQAILNEYIREVTVHSTAEELVLYPNLESMAGSGRAVDINHLRQGHQKIKEGLHRVEEMTSQENKGVKRSPVLVVLTAVMKELNDHMHTEEKSDLVKVREEMDDATKKRLGAEFNFAKT
ncbi:hypothetical protein HDU93_009157, partial [Gonapodya sp. JEL0774]